MRCVECSSRVKNLYTEYSKGNIRLTQCVGGWDKPCRKFADKYVEHDFIIIFIDMLLLKPQVYRHILFNRLQYDEGTVNDASVLKLGVLLVLFDVYIKWFRIEKYNSKHGIPQHDHGILAQYLHILLLCLVESISYHAAVRGSIYLQRLLTGKPAKVKYDYVSMAIIISSFGKMLLILMVIWDYSTSSIFDYSWLISLLVTASHFEALSVLIDAGTFPMLFVMSIALVMRTFAQLAYLWVSADLTLGWTHEQQEIGGWELLLPLVIGA